MSPPLSTVLLSGKGYRSQARWMPLHPKENDISMSMDDMPLHSYDDAAGLYPSTQSYFLLSLTDGTENLSSL